MYQTEAYLLNLSHSQNAEKILLVTGGASGIGASLSRRAADQGYHVVINFRSRQQEAEILAQEIRTSGRKATAMGADVSNAEAVSAMFRTIDKELGCIWGLVNCAGVSAASQPIAELENETLEKLLHNNIMGTMFPAQEAVSRMSTVSGGTGGVIVNVSSMAATIGGRKGSVAYAATKGVIDVFTKGLAREVADQNIRVNAVRPGMTFSEMTKDLNNPAHHAAIAATIPLGRIAEADEVVTPILWLLSDEASFITGSILDVSGGGFTFAS